MTLECIQTAEPGPIPSTRRLTVMVVDDNPDDVLIVGRCLRKIGGWSVDLLACLSLEEAIAALPGKDVALVFLDYDLGPWTGLEALEQLNQAGLDAPVIMMTGMSNSELVLEAFHAGVADYLPKDVLGQASVARAARNAVEKADLSLALHDRNAELEHTVEHLRERQREIESFYHGLSHELKTPLTAAREFVSLVIDGVAGELEPRQAELLETALRSCDQMVVCMNDILDASRLDTGKMDLGVAPTDLWELVHDVVGSVEASAAEGDLLLETRLGTESAVAAVDRARIYQVLTNLVGNAIKFTPSGGRIVVSIEDDGPKRLRLAVKDTGRGIDPEDRARIFDRLYQTRREDSAVSGGLGMGLFICRELVQLHGSSLHVESEPGAGSTFWFSLPRSAPPTNSGE